MNEPLAPDTAALLVLHSGGCSSECSSDAFDVAARSRSLPRSVGTSLGMGCEILTWRSHSVFDGVRGFVSVLARAPSSASCASHAMSRGAATSSASGSKLTLPWLSHT